MIQKKATGPPSFIFTKSSIKESLKIPFCGTIIKQFRSNQEDLVLYRNQTKSMSKPEHLSLYPYQNYFPSKSEDQMYLCNKSSRSNPEPPNPPPLPLPFTKWNLTVFHRPRSLPLNKPRLSYFRPRQGGHSPTHTKKKRQMTAAYESTKLRPLDSGLVLVQLTRQEGGTGWSGLSSSLPCH